MFEEIMWWRERQYRRIIIRMLLKLGSMLADSIALIGLSKDLDVVQDLFWWAKQRVGQNSSNDDTPNGRPVFRASSAFERGKLDIKEHGKKSTRFDDNERNVEMLLRTVISVKQLSIHGICGRKVKQLGQKLIRRVSSLEILQMRRWNLACM